MACGAAVLAAAAAESHVHVLDRRLQALMARGVAGSETFRALVARLDASPIQRGDQEMNDKRPRNDATLGVGGERSSQP